MALLKGKQDQIIIPLAAELDADHGKLLTVRFEATIKRLPYDEAQDVFRAIQNRADNSGEPSDETLVSRYVLGWKMPGPDGTDVPFSDEALQEALQERGYRDALIEGVMTMLLGKKVMERLRQKN